MDIKGYQVVIEALLEEDGGGYVATVPQLPGCMADGETRAEALGRVEDAMLTWAFMAEKMGREIPAPDRAYA
jgi:antitoxin HicB